MAANNFDRMNAVEIREAAPEDNDGLLALTRVTPMVGRISLRIDRNPDFFALLRARGKAIVYVAAFEGTIVGCISAALHTSYISGALEAVAHVGDLKVHPHFSGAGLALRLISVLDTRLRAEGIDLCLCLMSDGNDRALRLTDGKYGTPAVVHQGRFIVDQLIPSPVASFDRSDYGARPADLPAIAEMLDRMHRQRSFATPVALTDLEQRLEREEPATFSKIMVIREAGRVVATLTLEDTQHLRQNVLIGLPTPLRIAFSVLRVGSRVISTVSVPRVGHPLAVLYVRFMACAEGHELALRRLIAAARAEAFRRRFTFLSVGLHEHDPIRGVVSGTPRFSFTSRVMITSLITQNRAQNLVTQTPYEDFALV